MATTKLGNYLHNLLIQNILLIIYIYIATKYLHNNTNSINVPMYILPLSHSVQLPLFLKHILHKALIIFNNNYRFPDL